MVTDQSPTTSNEYDDRYIEEKYNEIKQNVMGMGIIVCLRLHKSMNLAGIAEILLGDATKKTTVLHHVKNLLKDRYIDLDPETMRLKIGKYYKVGPLSEAIFEYAKRKYQDSEADFTELLESITYENMYDRIRSELKSLVNEDVVTQAEMISNINRNIESLLFKKLNDLLTTSKHLFEKNPENLDAKINEIIEENKWAFSNMQLQYYNIPIRTLDQSKEFALVLRKIHNLLFDIERRFLKENKNTEISDMDKKFGSPINQYFYMFTAPLEDNVRALEKPSDNN